MLLDLTITARSPLAFARSKPGAQFRASLPYIPGGALFGALAGALREANALDETLLRAIRCSNAYPVCPGEAWSRPLPATARRPKGDRTQPPFDILATLVCLEQLELPGLPFDGAALESADGFYTLCGKSDAGNSYRQDQVKKREVTQRVLTRVAINRRRGTAEDQRLYSPLVLNEYVKDDSGAALPTTFRGSIELPDSPAVRAALEAVTHLGGRQSSGLGAVAIKATAADQESGAAILERVTALTTRFQAETAALTALSGRGVRSWPIPERSLFTINLSADAILLNDGWLPTIGIDERLPAAYGVKARLVRAFAAPLEVGGWNVIWQRPKPIVPATAMGGVFLFQAEQPLDAQATAGLARLQAEGVGERRQEGYGQLRICDEFHLTSLERRQAEE